MKNKKTNKWLKSILVAVILVPCMCLFSACSLFSKPSSYDEAVKNGYTGSKQDWYSGKGTPGKDGVDGKDANNYQDYLKLKEKGYTGSFEDYLREFLTEKVNLEASVSKALSSVVAVHTPTSAGSGVLAKVNNSNQLIADDNFYVITNYHVVSGQWGTVSNFKCNLYGESKEYNAVFIGGTQDYDIAVLKIVKGQGFENSIAKPVEFATEKINVGKSCFAIGNAEDEGIAVTKGMVSVDSEIRSYQNGVSLRVMRHQTPITHGNSGGGLFNTNGQLIGITNGGEEIQITDNKGCPTFINFAIPIDIVEKCFNNIIDNCVGTIANRKMEVCRLGVSSIVIEAKNIINENGLVELVETVKITDIDPNGVIGKNGTIKIDDVIDSISIDGKATKITRSYQVKEALIDARKGDTVKLTVTRSGSSKPITASFVVDTLYSVD